MVSGWNIQDVIYDIFGPRHDCLPAQWREWRSTILVKINFLVALYVNCLPVTVIVFLFATDRLWRAWLRKSVEWAWRTVVVRWVEVISRWHGKMYGTGPCRSMRPQSVAFSHSKSVLFCSGRQLIALQLVFYQFVFSFFTLSRWYFEVATETRTLSARLGL